MISIFLNVQLIVIVNSSHERFFRFLTNIFHILIMNVMDVYGKETSSFHLNGEGSCVL